MVVVGIFIGRHPYVTRVGTYDIDLMMTIMRWWWKFFQIQGGLSWISLVSQEEVVVEIFSVLGGLSWISLVSQEEVVVESFSDSGGSILDISCLT